MTQNYRTPTNRIKKAVTFDEKSSLTKQAFKNEADVNVIVARYRKTGVLPQNNRQAQFGDFADVPTYMEALNLVADAQNTFYALPAEVRLECENNPAIFLERVKDPEWAKKHKLTADQAEGQYPMRNAVEDEPLPLVASPAPTTGNAGASNPPSAKKNGAEKSGTQTST